MKYVNDKVLLVGNGFNLVSDEGASWNKLLNRIAGEPSTKHEEEIRKAKPFTLWFEEIIRNSSSTNTKSKISNYLEETIRNPSPTNTKSEISSYLKEYLSPNRHHIELMNLGFTNVLTTNYDYNLENADGQTWIKDHPAKEDYYSLFRRNSVGEQNVWHIHGELNTPSSIMLGHEQYSGYIQKIRNFITTGVQTNAKKRQGRPYLSKFASRKSTTKGDVSNWVDLFLEQEVHILGFSFDYNENHLWNLVMFKERLSRKQDSIGKTYYHRCSDHEQTTADEAKLSILNSLGVITMDHVGFTYEEAYVKCVKYLK